MTPLDRTLKQTIRDVPDFPDRGDLFQDITPLLANPELFAASIAQLADHLADHEFDVVVAPGNRGFMVAAPLALRMGVGLVIARHDGKLPGATLAAEETFQGRRVHMEIHADAFPPGTRAAIVDDVLSTGTTARTVSALVERLGGRVVACGFVMEMGFQTGRERLGDLPVYALTTF